MLVFQWKNGSCYFKNGGETRTELSGSANPTECSVGHCPIEVCERLCKETNRNNPNNPATSCEHTKNNPANPNGDNCVAFHGAVPIVDNGQPNPHQSFKQCLILGNDRNKKSNTLVLYN